MSRKLQGLWLILAVLIAAGMAVSWYYSKEIGSRLVAHRRDRVDHSVAGPDLALAGRAPAQASARLNPRQRSLACGSVRRLSLCVCGG